MCYINSSRQFCYNVLSPNEGGFSAPIRCWLLLAGTCDINKDIGIQRLFGVLFFRVREMQSFQQSIYHMQVTHRTEERASHTPPTFEMGCAKEFCTSKRIINNKNMFCIFNDCVNIYFLYILRYFYRPHATTLHEIHKGAKVDMYAAEL